jgi:hypothetical protein
MMVGANMWSALTKQRKFSFLLMVALILALIACGCVERCEEKEGCFQTNVIVQDLYRESSAFHAFYRAEKRNIPKCICWVEDKNLSEDLPGLTDPSKNTTYLKRIPPKVDDDFIIAHELCTYIIAEEGFPGTQPIPDKWNPGIALVSGQLNSMVWTPLRDLILSKYGFDLEKRYEGYRDVLLTKPYPVSELDALDSVFLYAEIVLYWEDVLHKAQPTEWQEQFDQQYPQIAYYGRTVVGKIREFGYDKPEKMSTLFLDIIEWSNILDGKVELVER